MFRNLIIYIVYITNKWNNIIYKQQKNETVTIDNNFENGLPPSVGVNPFVGRTLSYQISSTTHKWYFDTTTIKEIGFDASENTESGSIFYNYSYDTTNNLLYLSIPSITNSYTNTIQTFEEWKTWAQNSEEYFNDLVEQELHYYLIKQDLYPKGYEELSPEEKQEYDTFKADLLQQRDKLISSDIMANEFFVFHPTKYHYTIDGDKIILKEQYLRYNDCALYFGEYDTNNKFYGNISCFNSNLSLKSSYYDNNGSYQSKKIYFRCSDRITEDGTYSFINDNDKSDIIEATVKFYGSGNNTTVTVSFTYKEQNFSFMSYEYRIYHYGDLVLPFDIVCTWLDE